jgi:preprotein translocase subunit SecA
MAFSLEEKFQRELNFAVVDEVDSILIDEARTPLIISGQAEDSSRLYIEINKLIPLLKEHIEEEEGVVTQEGHYRIDEKVRQVELNERATSSSKSCWSATVCWPRAKACIRLTI